MQSKRTVILVLVLASLVGLLFSLSAYAAQIKLKDGSIIMGELEQDKLRIKTFLVRIANPSAVYCKELGYKCTTKKTEKGEIGICEFPDGSSCSAWEFLKGRCGQEYSYCHKKGYKLKTLSNNRKCASIYSKDCAVCVLKDGTEVEVSTLMKLEKEVPNGELTISFKDTNTISIAGKLCEVKLKNGTILKGSIVDKELNVKTRYGKLKISTKDISSVIFTLEEEVVVTPEPTPEVTARPLEGLVAKVGEDVIGGEVVINLGSRDGVEVGHVFNVSKIIEIIEDPKTEEVILRRTEKIAEIKISEVHEQAAIGKIILKGIEPIEVGDLVDLQK